MSSSSSLTADRSNDMSAVIEADRAHVWHHLIQHKPFETIDPLIIVEGKGMRVWMLRAKSIWMRCLAGFGPSTWAMAACRLQMRCAIS